MGETQTNRGVLYIKWGDKHDQVMNRSIASVRKHHPELPVEVKTLGPSATLLDKAEMFDWSPFEQTLFLDLDTILLDRVDYGFDRGAQFGLACCICECPWARRYPSLQGDAIEYNTGVLFFTRAAKPFFDAWKAVGRTIDSSIRFLDQNKVQRIMPHNDQAGFAKAVEMVGQQDCRHPFILPMNWNYRPQWQASVFGPIKIWHDYRDVSDGVLQWNATQVSPQNRIFTAAMIKI